jgi:molybdate transport system regulatory protein
VADSALLSGELRLAGRLDARFFCLLQALADTGSIHRAARASGYSYRGAWMLLEAASNLSHAPLLETARGGSRGGGSHLTAEGHALLACWQQLQQAHAQFLREQDAWLLQHPALAGTLRRMGMKTTARNQFVGTVEHIERGPVSAQVTLRLPGGEALVAALTSSAVDDLGLEVGGEALALVKSSAIVLVADFAGFRLSARNQLAGVVSRIEKGAVAALVMLTLPGGAVLSASVTQDAVVALDLRVGSPATAVFKAYAVMLAAAKT